MNFLKQIVVISLAMISTLTGAIDVDGRPVRDCNTPGCEFAFHACEFHPSGPMKGSADRYPNDYAKTIYCDAPWRVSSLDDAIPIYIQIEGTDVDGLDEMQCIGVYDVTGGAVPPDPVEDFWGDYQYTPDHPSQVYKVECGGCELHSAEEGMYWRVVNTFLNDGSDHGSQPDGTPLSARNMGYSESDLGTCITLTIRIIYEESLNWTDIHDQDLKIYLGTAPLPDLPNWYLGDSHTHTWSTYYLMEIGASGLVMFDAMKLAGLHWELVSDHGYNLTETKWQTILTECAAGTVPDGFIALAGEECDDGYHLDNAHHFLGFGLTNWIETYGINPPYLDSISQICAQGGFTFGAHTTDLDWSWSDQEIRDALTFTCFRGMQDYNSRLTHSSEDVLHPWGNTPNTGTWDQTHTDWDSYLLTGLNRWDRFLSERINDARYTVFFLGGSDAHGSMNYHVDWDVLKRDSVTAAYSNALGKVRTAVYCPAGLTQTHLLDQISSGRMVVTDGPMLVQGLSTSGPASSYETCDIHIGDTVSITVDLSDATYYLEWISSSDYGPVRWIRVFRGDAATDQAPVIVYEFAPPNGMHDIENTIPVSIFLDADYADGDSNPDLYLRAVAYTYNPYNGPDAPGEPSVPGFDPMSYQYHFRAFTNPIWIDVQPALTPTGTPTSAATPTPLPPLPASSPSGILMVILIFTGLTGLTCRKLR
ncbi:hypothetical protein JW979_02020 [bacterium]|nr:hypothetical protein [candidate division CSSED10-310 bacterium]